MKRFFTILFLLIAISALGNRTSKDLFVIGTETFNSGSYSSAELIFRKIVERNDSYMDRAWFYLARSVFEQKKYRAAVFEFNSFLTHCRSEILRVESRYWLGDAYYKTGENLKSIEELKRFVSKSKDKILRSRAYKKIGLMYFREKRYAESVIEFNKSIKESNDREHNAEIIYLIGLSLFESGNLDKAISRISPLIYSHVGEKIRMKLRILLGRIYQSQGKNKQAVILFNTVTDKYAGVKPFYDLYYYRALAYADLKKYKKAGQDLDIFSSIASQSPLYLNGLFLLGKIQVKLGNKSAGIALFDRVWRGAGDNELRYESALILSELLIDSDPGKVEVYLKEFRDIDDKRKKKRVLILLARAHGKSGRLEESEKILDFYLENYPFDDNLDEIYFLRALIFIERKNFEKASFYFDKIKQEMPFSKFLDDSNYYLALVRYKQKNLYGAKVLLEKYLRAKKIAFRVEALSLLLKINTDLKKWKQARKYAMTLYKSFRKTKGVDKSLVEYAMAIYPHDPSLAEYFFKKILRDFPRTHWVMRIYLFKGKMSFESKRYGDAIQFFEKYLNSDAKKDRGLAFFSLVMSYYKLEKYGKVVALIERGNIPPMSESQWQEIPLLRVRSLYRLGEYARVYSLLKYRVVSDLSDSDFLIFLQSLIKLGNIDRAVIISKKIKKKEVAVRANILLSDFFELKGNYERAIQLLLAELRKPESGRIYDEMRVKVANLLIRQGKTQDVLKILNSVNSSALSSEVLALRILYYFKIGDGAVASKMTRKKISELNKSGFFKEILGLNVAHSLKINSASDFRYYSRSFYRYDRDAVNFYRGKFYLKNKNFGKSYYNFYKLAFKKGKYFEEVNYNLGMISLLFYKNYKKALRFFSALNFSKKPGYFSVMAGIESVRILFEMNKYHRAVAMAEKLEKIGLSAKNREALKNLRSFYKR